jgi:hypothetical protein
MDALNDYKNLEENFEENFQTSFQLLREVFKKKVIENNELMTR